MIERLTKDDTVYDTLHRYDSRTNRHYDYENSFFSKTLSRPVRSNPLLAWFLVNLSKMTGLMIDSGVVVRNYFNITVDKYYNDHCN